MALRINLRKVHLKPRGKNSKLAYQWRCFIHHLTPQWYLKKRYAYLMNQLNSRSDVDDIFRRVNYYCRLNEPRNIHGDLCLAHVDSQKYSGNYFKDYFEYARYFPRERRVDCAFGDNTKIPPTPCITKSRPICDKNENCVLFNLDKVRHFIFLKDKRSFSSKIDKAIFRGATHQIHRQRFMEKYFGSQWVDCGDTDERPNNPLWKKPLITLYDHLRYKFVISLEGNDVASNLKWIMSSNSVAVMPKPKFETWFMEGTLIPNVHYILIKDDYSDLPERLSYYIEHPKEAEAIIQNAHEFISQFQDKEKEDLIHLLVLNKYFELTQQK